MTRAPIDSGSVFGGDCGSVSGLATSDFATSATERAEAPEEALSEVEEEAVASTTDGIDGAVVDTGAFFRIETGGAAPPEFSLVGEPADGCPLRHERREERECVGVVPDVQGDDALAGGTATSVERFAGSAFFLAAFFFFGVVWAWACAIRLAMAIGSVRSISANLVSSSSLSSLSSSCFISNWSTSLILDEASLPDDLSSATLSSSPLISSVSAPDSKSDSVPVFLGLATFFGEGTSSEASLCEAVSSESASESESSPVKPPSSADSLASSSSESPADMPAAPFSEAGAAFAGLPAGSGFFAGAALGAGFGGVGCDGCCAVRAGGLEPHAPMGSPPRGRKLSPEKVGGRCVCSGVSLCWPIPPPASGSSPLGPSLAAGLSACTARLVSEMKFQKSCGRFCTTAVYTQVGAVACAAAARIKRGLCYSPGP